MFEHDFGDEIYFSMADIVKVNSSNGSFISVDDQVNA